MKLARVHWKSLALGFSIATLFFWLLWPGLYIFMPAGGDLVRVNKLTGTKQYATDSGWFTQEEIIAKSNAERDRETRQFVSKLKADFEARKVNDVRFSDSNLLLVQYRDGSTDSTFVPSPELRQMRQMLQAADVPFR